MVIYTIITFLLVFIPWGVHAKDFNNDYLSRESTTAIKGILTTFVPIAHFVQNCFTGTHPLDYAYFAFREFVDQLPIVIIFFYSAYGIMESIKKKGFDYTVKIPVNRILKTLIIYDIAQLILLCVNTYKGIHYSLSDTILAFTGWRAIGSDNWFIFLLFVFYFITWVAFRMYRENYFKAACTITLGSFAFIVFLIKFNKDPFWYNTLLTYCLGIWFSLYKEKLQAWLFNNKHYFITLALCIAAFVYLWVIVGGEDHSNQVVYEICSILYLSLVILLTMKINVTNPVLKFLGKHMFGVYLMHRAVLVMMPQVFIYCYPHLSFVIFFVLTLIAAWLFDTLTGKLTKKLIKS